MANDEPHRSPITVHPSFPLDLTQAAHILAMTETDVTDLVRTRALPAYLASKLESPSPMHFSTDVVTRLAASMLAEKTKEEANDIHFITSNLRAYLKERPPIERHRKAVDEQLPLLAHVRGMSVFAHIKPPALLTYMRVRNPGPDNLLRITRAAMVLEKTLLRLGAVRVRGLRPSGETKQRWDYWYRLPRSFWGPTGPDLMDMPTFGDIPVADHEPTYRDNLGAYARTDAFEPLCKQDDEEKEEDDLA